MSLSVREEKSQQIWWYRVLSRPLTVKICSLVVTSVWGEGRWDEGRALTNERGENTAVSVTLVSRHWRHMTHWWRHDDKRRGLGWFIAFLPGEVLKSGKTAVLTGKCLLAGDSSTVLWAGWCCTHSRNNFPFSPAACLQPSKQARPACTHTSVL